MMPATVTRLSRGAAYSAEVCGMVGGSSVLVKTRSDAELSVATEQSRTMATPKTGSLKEGCSRLAKTFDIALKKSERNLLLSRTYGLNGSWSKKVNIGLRLRLDGTFEPVVKFVNNYSSGVSLNAEAWEDLAGKLEDVEKYFEKNERPSGSLSSLLSDTVSLAGGCALRLTSAHGSKVVAFYASNPDAAESQQGYEEEEEEGHNTGEPGWKKRKTYSPVIVMQKVTFDGLRHIACCIDGYIIQLEQLAEEADRCKELLVRHFAGIVRSRKMTAPTLQQIGVVVCEEAEAAKDALRRELPDVNFGATHLNVVFHELTRLFLSYIIADIRQSVIIDK